jgi:uncharacterized protein (UPF0335 family)
MEIRSTEEAKQNTENFTKEMLKLMLQKKSIDEEIKDVKSAYKEDGVPVNTVCKAISKIKTNKKKSQSAQYEEEIISEWLENNKDIDDMITTLIAK